MSKRRATWGKKDLAAALNAIESGTSQRDAAKAFNIPRRTLRNYVQSGKTFKNLGRSSVLTAVQEKELCSQIVRFSDIGLSITPQVIKVYVFDYCQANSIPNPFNSDKASAGRPTLNNGRVSTHSDVQCGSANRQTSFSGRAMSG